MVFHLYQDVVGNWRWYLAAPNGVKLAVSPVGYPRRLDCVQAINRLRDEAGDAAMLTDHFAPFQQAGGALISIGKA